MTINTYLNFDGNTEEAFKFYKSVFGGEFNGKINYIGDMPGGDQFPENERKRVMHIALPIGKSGAVLMGSDILPSAGHKLNIGNHAHISIHPDSEAEADRLFKGLSAGGNVVMPLEKTFWGAYFGLFTDKFGVSWMVNYAYN